MPFWKKDKKVLVAPRLHERRKLRLEDNVSTESPEPYIYQPLTSTNDFRLLELKPGSGGDPVRCTLRLASLSSLPLYDAVSYTWGLTSPLRTIYVDSHYLKVRQNLYDVLTDLRHAHHSQTFWVDAICINQKDSSERSDQVRRMASIYRNAVTVVAWLQDLGYVIDGHECSISGLLGPTDNLPRMAKARLIEAFFHHGYWSRRWIVQEIALARSVNLCCGSVLVPLATVKLLLGQHASLREGGKYINLRNRLAVKLCDLQESGLGPNSTLAQLLLDYDSTQCEDPLDKVYALVSMSALAQRTLAISYENRKVDLLLSTLEFSSTLENLAPQSAIIFALMLGRQLSWTPEMMPKPGDIYKDHTGRVCEFGMGNAVTSFLNCIGTVTSSVIDPMFFDAVRNLREKCGAIRALDATMYLEILPQNNVLRRAAQLLSTLSTVLTWEPWTGSIVSPRDLFAFVWQSSHFDGDLLIGFASCRTQTGDTLYQFPGTNLGIILRTTRTDDKVRILGRARLARVAAGENFIMTMSYGNIEGETGLEISSRGWNNLDLILLASDNC